MGEKLLEKLIANRHQVAYVASDKSITYDELTTLAVKYAQILNCQDDSPVIIYGHKSVDIVTAIVSCIIARRAYIPIEVGMPISRIEKIIEISGASLFIKTEPIDFKPSISCYALEELPQFKQGRTQQTTNDIAYIMFTTGTTGEPKGVPISYANLENFVKWISNLDPLVGYKQINVLNQVSFSFDVSCADLFYALFNGHTLYAITTPEIQDYQRMIKLFDRSQINLIVATPTFIKMCLLDHRFNAESLPSIHCIYLCGETLEIKTTKKLFKLFPNLKLLNAYGPTEATSAVSASLITSEMVEGELLPVGDINNLATGVEIEEQQIILYGPSVFSGYLQEIKGGHYTKDGVDYYATGDIGYIKDNNLYCVGRINNQVKYMGYRIELLGVERLICDNPKVIDCAVIAKYNNTTVKSIWAYVVLAKDSNIEQLKAELRQTIPSYMIPNRFIEVDELPVNKNFKIDRKALGEL